MAASSAADGTQPQFQIDPSLLPDQPSSVGEYFDLQQYFDFNIANEDLHNTWSSPFNRRMPRNDNDPLVSPEDQEVLYNAWKRVRIPYLDCNVFGNNYGDILDQPGGLGVETWEAYEDQHNGLWELRHNLQNHGELFVPQGSGDNAATIIPSKEAIHHLAYRIVSQIQQQEGAALGAFPEGRWWIAPQTEAIELPVGETPSSASNTAPKEPKWLAKARAASYTIHWVCYTDTRHIAVIIRETETGHSWYFDSASFNSQEADDNHQAVLSGLHRWCLKYNINIPDGNRHRRVEVIPHDLAWTCGLHAIAHTLAFLRFGLLGWHEVSRWMRPQGDEAKLKKMRHDLMKALELSMGYRLTRRAGAAGIPLPEHYDDDANLSMFRFPSYPSVGLNREDLHNCEEFPFTEELLHIDAGDQAILRDIYRRVHVECHDGISLQGNEENIDLWSYRVYSELHDGLQTMRRRGWLSAQEVHYHATRLIAKVQESVDARLGPARAENQEWWIAPDCYVIKCKINSETDQEEDQHGHISALSVMEDDHEELMRNGWARDLSMDREKYLRAKYTVHWVHHSYKVDHWAVIVREAATNFAWYFDSLEDDREQRKDHAIRVFNEWLARSGVTAVSASFLIPALEQATGWECGLHAAAHAMAFIRFGVLGWHALPNAAITLDVPPTGTGDNAAGLDPSGIPQRLCETMTSALHGLMGVALQKSLPPSQEDGNKTASNEAIPSKSDDKTNTDSTERSDPDSGNANGEASRTQPSDVMGSSNQSPGDNPNGFKPIKRTDASSGRIPVPQPSFFSHFKYNQQALGFRFPTYPSIPLEPHLVRSVRESPYNNKIGSPDAPILRPAYLRVDRICCDKVWLTDTESLNAYEAYFAIHNALVDMRNDDYLEDRGMYHLACRLISIVMGQTGANRSSDLGLWGDGNWWIAPRPFWIDIPSKRTGQVVEEPQTFSELIANGEETSLVYLLDGNVRTFEESFDDALYTVHFVHSSEPLHWTVIIRERDTGLMWHFDSHGDAAARKQVFNGAVDGLTAWLRRCGKEIPEKSCAYNVPTPAQDQGWECSFHAIAHAMAFLRFGILGWSKLKCIALETDPTPSNPTSTVNVRQLREIMRRSLHGIFGLITKKDDKNLAEHLKGGQDAIGNESMDIRLKKAAHDLQKLVGESPNQRRLNEEEQEKRLPREQQRKEQESRARQAQGQKTQGQPTQEPQGQEESEADTSAGNDTLIREFEDLPDGSTLAEADGSPVQGTQADQSFSNSELMREFDDLPDGSTIADGDRPQTREPQTPERPVESPHNNSMSGLSPANRSWDELGNNSSFLRDLADERDNVLAAQRSQRLQKKKAEEQNLLKKTLQKTYKNMDKKAQEEEERRKKKAQEEEEAKRKAQEEEEKRKTREEQEKQKQQQQVASKSRKRGAPDGDDDGDESDKSDPSGRSPKRAKQTPEGPKTPKKTPEKIPTPVRTSEENLPQSPSNKRKTPPPDAAEQPQPAKRVRREPTPAPKAPARQSERQKAQEATVAPAEADEEELELTEIEEEVTEVTEVEDEPAWLATRRESLGRMSKAQLIEQCRQRRLAGPPVDRVKTLAYSGYNRLDLVGRLLWYDDPAGMQVALDGRPLDDFDLEELKQLCKMFELFYGGTDEERMRQRLRWFFEEQQRFVQTLIEAEEIPENWQDFQVPVEEDAEEDSNEDEEEEDGETTSMEKDRAEEEIVVGLSTIEEEDEDEEYNEISEEP